MKRWVGVIDRGFSRDLLFARPWWKREWTFDDGCEDSSKNKCREDYRSGLENPCPLGYGPAVRRSIGEITESFQWKVSVADHPKIRSNGLSVAGS